MSIIKVLTVRRSDFTAHELFPPKRLMRLLIPLFIEQALGITIGFADTIMVSSLGDAAVSSVSLVDQINILLITVFASLATGGAVVTSQYLGRGDRDKAGKAAKQLIYISFFVSAVIAAISLIFNNNILRLIYGKITSDVMDNAVVYYYITAASYPFLALYNAGAAIFRASGNSRISMVTSIIMNIINVTGNAILIYGLQIGVAGAAAATLLARIVGALIMLILLCRPASSEAVKIENPYRFEFDGGMLKSILRIGIPNGLENSIFQIGKLCVAGVITGFGTAAIAANAIGGTIANIAILPGSTINLALITVVGQCVGAGDYRQAEYHTRNLIGTSMLAMAITNSLTLLFLTPIVNDFHLSGESMRLAVSVIRVYAPMCVIFHSISFGLPNTLRAAGDVRFTMLVSLISMWLFRIACCFIFASVTDFGLQSAWYAMYIDWIVRSSFFLWRFFSGRWKTKNVLK